MTLKQTGLLPTSCNDIRAVLGVFELVAGGRLQLGEIVRAEVRQGMTLEPSPQIFDRIQIGRVRRQQSDLDMPIDAAQIIRSGCLRWALSALRNSTISSFLMLPS